MIFKLTKKVVGVFGALAQQPVVMEYVGEHVIASMGIVPDTTLILPFVIMDHALLRMQVGEVKINKLGQNLYF